jgi:glucan phosphoethanolaminetransferase (alkaline phosphatase superfamily)
MPEIVIIRRRDIAVMHERDSKKIMRDFRLRLSRQFLAIATTLVLLLFLALLHKHPDLLGNFTKSTIFAAQIVLIAAFIGFSALNWRCPLCKKYLGKDISRRICRHCGTRLR